MTKKTKVEAIGDGVDSPKANFPSRDNLYARIANHLPKAIDKAVEMLESPNENVRLGAIKVLLDRGLPPIKALEITGPDGGPLQIRYIVDLAGGYIPPLGAFNGSSAGSYQGPSQVQSIGLAQTSPQDDHSTDGAS